MHLVRSILGLSIDGQRYTEAHYDRDEISATIVIMSHPAHQDLREKREELNRQILKEEEACGMGCNCLEGLRMTQGRVQPLYAMLPASSSGRMRARTRRRSKRTTGFCSCS